MTQTPVPGATALSAADLCAWISAADAAIDERAAWLTELDAAIGDADHGTNMRRGMHAAREAADGIDLSSQDAVPALLKKVAMALISKVGGTSGPLYGTFFLRMATAAGTATSLDATTLATVLRAGVEGIQARGHAVAGEKTMLDAWLPAVEAWDAALADGADLTGAAQAAAVAGREGRDATEAMVATKGRASYLGERSAGHLDPGAASTAILLDTLARTAGAAGVDL